MSADANDHTLTGEFRTHARFRSRFLPNERTILVYVPPGYQREVDGRGRGRGRERSRRYPVLYLQDGQNVFDKATSFGQEWHVDETAQSLIESGQIEPLIVVAIYNTGVHRVDEYTPTHVPGKGGGRADQYGRMLVEEIKPLIDRKYKTLPSAASTGLGGSSLGGLLTLHVGLNYPTVFNRLAVLSPSVWWDERAIVRRVQSLSAKLPLRIWLDAGTGEGADVVADTRALRDALLAKGWVTDHDLRYLEAEGAEHNEQSWGGRVGEVLKFLFPKRGPRGR
ncbi:MAG TPA: alpha/beta hydrolase-fold protein [Gemmatimonadaceae bacterium]|jgi:predicted alpha/beta superfamily hydrolase